MKRPKPVEHDYEFRLRVTKIVNVTVTAKTPQEAKELAESGDWVEQRDQETIDWTIEAALGALND
jgi:hypothetical protein